MTANRLRAKAGFGGRALALTVALAICAAANGPAFAQDKVKVRIAYIPVITWLPAMIAKDEGLFEKNGLDVEMTKFPNIINLPGTLGKQFDMVPTTAPDLLNAASHGLNIAAVAGETIETAGNKSFQVMVRPTAASNLRRT